LSSSSASIGAGDGQVYWNVRLQVAAMGEVGKPRFTG
jgi:hypothetical protein